MSDKKTPKVLKILRGITFGILLLIALAISCSGVFLFFYFTLPWYNNLDIIDKIGWGSLSIGSEWLLLAIPLFVIAWNLLDKSDQDWALPISEILFIIILCTGIIVSAIYILWPSLIVWFPPMMVTAYGVPPPYGIIYILMAIGVTWVVGGINTLVWCIEELIEDINYMRHGL